MMALSASLAERFWRKIDKAGPIPEHAPDLGRCWLWTASVNGHGYGQLRSGGRGSRTLLAHHVSLAIARRPLPRPGEHTDHLCRRRSCANPAHLEIVVHGENLRRGNGVKLTPALADRARRDPRSCRAVARDLGVHHSRISAIRRGEAWA